MSSWKLKDYHRIHKSLQLEGILTQTKAVHTPSHFNVLTISHRSDYYFHTFGNSKWRDVHTGIKSCVTVSQTAQLAELACIT